MMRKACLYDMMTRIDPDFHICALYLLNGFYSLNESRLPKDETEAITWFRLAADQGNADAQTNLGGCFKMSREAAKWYKLAADQGQSVSSPSYR